jgi:hypothetical protein
MVKTQGNLDIRWTKDKQDVSITRHFQLDTNLRLSVEHVSCLNNATNWVDFEAISSWSNAAAANNSGLVARLHQRVGDVTVWTRVEVNSSHLTYVEHASEHFNEAGTHAIV